ncbi:amino acid adenylation domain-containing protein [Marinivivus vitaminiproducens]|uniref:amino acid adenylation domain-containing protein n=1 Tax=Marinivivus vitaminiproducens TaxID=3035935 RepID=UPI0027A84D66|nr:amino acid adenylation domain-containing protein [Geminicoccaceae bacterium SCSIO 64248]
MADIVDVYEMTPLQAGMLFHTLYQPESGAYFEQFWCVLEGPLDVEAYRGAWQQTVARHDVLRSACHWDDLDHPALVVHGAADPEWCIEDWSGLDAAAQDTRFAAWLADDRSRGFALDRAPLVRFALLRLGSGRHRFVWSFHHLLMDGWCGALLVREVLRRYAGGEAPPAPPSYRHFVEWRARQDRDAAEAYWRHALAGAAMPTPLGIERPRSGGALPITLRETLSAGLSADLTTMARDARLTLNTLVQGAWALLLARYSGAEDVVFGAVQSGRPPELPGVEDMVGLFLNTTPVRAVAAAGERLVPWLRDLQAEQRQRERFGYAALTDIQRWSGTTGSTLFDSLLIVETYPQSIESVVATDESSLRVSGAGSRERTHYALTLKVFPGDRIGLDLSADPARIEPADAKRLLAHLRTVLAQFAQRPDARLGEITLLDPAERDRLLRLGRGRERTPAPLVHEQILVRAGASPQAVAVELEDGTCLTYAELDRRSGAMAARLREQGAGPGTVVALCLERGAALVPSLLGVLRSGAAYLPLDPHYPAERIATTLADAGARLVLTDEASAPVLAGWPAIEVVNAADWLAQTVDDCGPDRAVDADAIAYILYTSGSTGRPKGVPIRHSSLSNFLASMAVRPGIEAGDRLLAVTTVAFDIAALELLGPLSQGGTVVLAEAASARDGHRLAALLRERAITILQATPSGWRLLVEAGWTGGTGLRMLCGGEALDAPLARALLERGGALWNLYGPTETTIWSAALRIDASMLDGAVAPIGEAIDETQLHVLDPSGMPAPTGVPGELHIGGAGLSPGYWNRPELAADAFVPNPFAGHPGEGPTLYRTGDQVRLRDDGRIDFLGRRDGQIKLRGFRIELGEIEACLANDPDVIQPVVTVRDDGGARLVAYLRLLDTAPADVISRLRDHLAAALPAHMLPSAYVTLDAFPLTPNGKIDRAALPVPGQEIEAAHEAGRSPVEELIAGVWAEALGVAHVGRDNGFFDLGGHSLLATRVLGQVRRALGVDLGLKDLFEASSFEGFCARVTAARDGGRPSLPSIVAGAVPTLSFAQRRHWLIARLDPDNPGYLLPIAVRLRGPLDRAALERALSGLVARHAVLRSVFPERDGSPALRVIDAAPIALPVEDLAALPASEREQALPAAREHEARSGFDLRAGPPWRVRLLRATEDEHVLLLTLHHILADEWSLDLLRRAIASGYAAALGNGPEPEVPQIQYADFAAWQRELDLAPQLDYWRRRLADAPTLLPLATDFPRPAVRTGAGACVPIRLSVAAVGGLRRAAQREGVTLFMTLLAAFHALLYRHTGSTDIVVGTPVANRQLAEVQEIIGLFVNTVAIRADLSGDPSFAALLGQVRDAVLDAHAHQDAPFEQVLEALGVPRSYSHPPLFQTLFSLQTLPPAGDLGAGLTWEPLPAPVVSAPFDLALALRETSDGLHGRIDYPVDLFAHATIEGMARRFEHLLEGLAAAIDRPLSELPLLGRDERALLARWSEGPPSGGRESTLQERFAAQAQATPHAIALSAPGFELDYAGLEDRVARLAGRLVREGVARGHRVGLWVGDHPGVIVALLAILRAGAAYVPLDPGYPLSRLRWIAGDAALRLIVRAAGGEPPDLGVATLDVTGPSGLPETGDLLPPVAGSPEDLAYILYTSGSTGEPKGVCVPHRGPLRLVIGADYVRLDAAETLLQAAPLTFDASVFEMFGALLNGGRLALTTGGDGSLAALGQTIREQGVTTLWLTAGLFHLVVDECPEILAPLRQLLAGGDRLSLAHVRKVQALFPQLRVINGYGPTETSTFACCHTIAAVDDLSAEGSPPIGRPISDTTVYVLDGDGQLTPPGVPGELHIGGAGLAHGYLNRPDRTAERFVPNLFIDPRTSAFEDDDLSLYRTGDLVRFAADGTILYLGRLDDQVKIRGFRVEPGEIEAVLVAHDGIRAAAVVVDEADARDRRLVAYAVPAAGSRPLDDPAMRAFLSERLPDYMVPAHVVWLDRLPLTANGKLDRRALPAPRRDLAGEEPQGETERMLAGIWASVLKCDRVGRSDNFFDLGGDSILAMQIVSRSAQAGLSIAPRHLFQHQTVAALAAVAAPRVQEAPKAPDRLTLDQADLEAALASVSFGEETDS